MPTEWGATLPFPTWIHAAPSRIPTVQPGGPGPCQAELGGLGLTSSFLSFPGTFLASSLFLEESLERARTAQATRAQTDDGKPGEEPVIVDWSGGSWGPRKGLLTYFFQE